MRAVSRRRFLKLGLAAATAGLLGRGHAQRRVALRLGLVLPARANRTLLQASSHGVAAEAALRGAVLAGENPQFSRLLGGDLEVLPGVAPDAAAATRIAHRLCGLEEVTALIGGHGPEQAAALSQVAAQHGVPFMNLGRAGDLREPLTFHLEPTPEMYLTALAGWLAPQGHERWLLVQSGEPAPGLAAVLRSAGAEQVETVAAAEGRADFGAAVTAAADLEPDFIALHLPWLQQLDLLERLETDVPEAAVAVVPDPVSQTREYLATVRERAPQVSARGRHTAVWDASLRHDLNDRFEGRWGLPMDPPAWTAWQAVRMLCEAVAATGSHSGTVLASHLKEAKFDAGKSKPLEFAAESGQLQQSLFVLRVLPDEMRARQLAEVMTEVY